MLRIYIWKQEQLLSSTWDIVSILLGSPALAALWLLFGGGSRLMRVDGSRLIISRNDKLALKDQSHALRLTIGHSKLLFRLL